MRCAAVPWRIGSGYRTYLIVDDGVWDLRQDIVSPRLGMFLSSSMIVFFVLLTANVEQSKMEHRVFDDLVGGWRARCCKSGKEKAFSALVGRRYVVNREDGERPRTRN